MICFIQFCSKDTQVSGNAPNLARVKRCFFPGTYRAFLGFQPFKPAPSTQLKQAWMHDSPPPPKAPESRPLVSPWTVPTPWKFRLTSGGMVQGCSLNRSRAVLTSSSCCSRPHAQSASGPDKGPPPPLPRSPLPTSVGDRASPGLSGAHSPEVRNHGFAVASAGGHRGHLGRPRAPGPGPPAAPPRPRPRRPRGFSEQRPPGRTRTKPLGCPSDRSGSGSRRRRLGRLAGQPPSPSVARSNKGRARGTHRNMSTH